MNFFQIKLFYFTVFFLIISLVSFIKSENLPESIITFSNYFSIFFCLINLIILNQFLVDPKKFFVGLVLLIFIAEVFLSFHPMLKDIFSSGLVNARSRLYIGAAANVNITSFSLVFKLPIILYYLETRKKFFSKFGVLLLISISFFVIIILNTRGAFLGLFLAILIYVFSLFFIKKKESLKTKFLKISFLLATLFLSVSLSNLFLPFQSESKFVNRASTISFDTKDGSVNQRLRYYRQALKSISNNPFLGIGVGNWKLKSIEHDKNNIEQYIIPYHAHNDYLQVAAESGILAFVFYIIVFMVILLMLYNFYLKKKEDLFYVMLFSSIAVYLLDSLLNFPIARPISQLSLILIFSFIIFLNVNDSSIRISNYYKGNIISIVLLFFSLTAIYSSYKNYISLKDQGILYADYMGLNKRMFYSSKDILKVQETFPNITTTTLPINELKANYFIQEEKYNEAIKILKEKNLNPYLGLRESLMAQAYGGLKNHDSTYKYFKMAFYKIPNNESHSTNLFNQLRRRNDANEIEKTFNMIKFKSPLVWKAYLNAKSEVLGPGNKEMIKIIDSLKKVYPEDEGFNDIYKYVRIGKANTVVALNAVQFAEKDFKEKRFKKAIERYLYAIKLDPFDFSYYENIALSYQNLGDTKNAYKYFDIVIDSLNPKTGKSEFYKGVNLIMDKEIKKGCILLKKSLNYGFSGARNVMDEFCN